MVFQYGTLLLAPLLPLVLSAGEPLVSQAAEGQRIRRTFEVESSMELIELKQSVGGDTSGSKVMPKVTRSSSEETVFTAIDEIRSVVAGEPTEFVRTYEGLKGKRAVKEKTKGMGAFGGSNESRDFKTPLKSALANQSILFCHNEEASWSKEPVEGGLLAAEQALGLDEDLSLDFLLPSSSVNRGAGWKVEGAELNRLLHFGGNLQFTEEKEEEDVLRTMLLMRVPKDPTKGQWDGQISCVHKGTKNTRGRKVVVVDLEVKTTMNTVASYELGSGGVVPQGGQIAPPSEVSTNYRTQYAGKGTLHFDPALQQVVHLELELDVTETVSESMAMPVPGGNAAGIETTEVSEGELRIAFRASAL